MFCAASWFQYLSASCSSPQGTNCGVSWISCLLWCANISFDFLESPIKYNDLEKKQEDSNKKELTEIKEIKEDYRQWWSATKDSVTNLDKFDTLEESMELLVKKWNSENYSGILGFSQGSVLVQIFTFFCETKKKVKTLEINYPPKFVILASSFAITDKTIKSEIDEYTTSKNKLKTPMCLMYGSKDSFVTKDQTLQILDYWNKEQCFELEHNGGHYVSTTKTTCELLFDFITKYST